MITKFEMIVGLIIIFIIGFVVGWVVCLKITDNIIEQRYYISDKFLQER